MSDFIHPIFDKQVQRIEREKRLNQSSKVIWLTGLSGSGKSTIALELEKKLFTIGYFSQVLDGDNIRSGICNNLGFSEEDRKENIRRIAEISKLYLNSGIISIVSFISPTVESRDIAKKIIGQEDFIEVFISTPIELCEKRDVKGLYKKARTGEIKNFTGIDQPYEIPLNADLEINTAEQTIDESVELLYNFIENKIKIKSNEL
jgi:adenylylsulfate kinase